MRRRGNGWGFFELLALGINEDLYGCGVALCENGQLVYAANEERFSRRKNHGGFPHLSLSGAFSHTGFDPSDVSRVCVSGITTPHLVARLFPRLQQGLWEAQSARTQSPLRHVADAMVHTRWLSIQRPRGFINQATAFIAPSLIRRALPPELRHAEIELVDHHATHLWCAYALSGFDSTLGITADGMGDGVSLAVFQCKGGSVERLADCPPNVSLGLFFEALTEAFGFVPSRDEGKLTGLAAHGNPDAVAQPSPFHVRDGRLRYRGPHGLRAVRWAERELLARHSREDVAAWAQRILEDCVIAIARHWLQQTGQRRLALGGGLFANVKLNQRLHELPEVDEIFVAPNMGDGGNPVGALAGAGALQPGRIEHVFLGDGYTDEQCAAALSKAGLDFDRPQNYPAALADCLAAGQSVARFDGRMEWGPRALGNRSILANAADPAVSARLNQQLRRSDFMPFAPAMLADEAGRFLHNHQSGLFAGEFMTVCYDCSPEMKRMCPAVVHVDGTARAQIVRASANPGLHAILSAYRERTGAGVLLNTSFNIHEEPIIRTPEEAIASFLKAGLDWLALGPYLVRQPAR